MLQDSSEDHKNTWLFLDRRMEDVLQIHTVLSNSANLPSPDKALNHITDTAAAVFITVKIKISVFILCSRLC